jgi:hypothetical protein
MPVQRISREFEAQTCELLLMKKPFKTLVTVNSFSPHAEKLRTHFESRFEDPRRTNADRFVWDYWHVPGQYTALRTPAYHFFPKKLYDAFHHELVWWGRRNLGCHDVSPPWMSCYVDGCRQELHGDLPHGPWAFVFSLTPWTKREFRGGETLLLKEDILSYWQGLKSQRGLEEQDIVTEVPALFNRLTVFDPRIPHGVRRVEGVQDVLKGRLVIHGWFVQPRPFIEGPLKEKDLQDGIDALSAELNRLFADGLDVQGTLSLRFQVQKNGKSDLPRILSNSVRHSAGNHRIERALLKHIQEFISELRFPKQRVLSQVTLPLVFEAGA